MESRRKFLKEIPSRMGSFGVTTYTIIEGLAPLELFALQSKSLPNLEEQSKDIATYLVENGLPFERKDSSVLYIDELVPHSGQLNVEGATERDRYFLESGIVTSFLDYKGDKKYGTKDELNLFLWNWYVADVGLNGTPDKYLPKEEMDKLGLTAPNEQVASLWKPLKDPKYINAYQKWLTDIYLGLEREKKK